MTFRGTFINGKVELEAGVSLPNGTPVRVEPLKRIVRKKALKPKGTGGLLRLAQFSVKTGIRSSDHNGARNGTASKRNARAKPVDPAYRLSELAINDGGPPDLAAEHDHYIYGTPKRFSRTARRSPPKRTPRR